MSSFNSQHNSGPISVTPILPSPLLSFPFFLAPSPHLFLPLGLIWTNTHQHTHAYTYFILTSLFLPSSSFSLRSCLCYIFARIAFFFFCCRVRAFEVNSNTVFLFSKFSLLCCGYHVTWIDFSRDVSDHILSLWRDPIRNPPECHALLCSKDHSHPPLLFVYELPFRHPFRLFEQ